MNLILLQCLLNKASQYQITSIKAFQIAQELCSVSFQIFELIEDKDEQISLQASLESRIVELFSQSYQSYTQNLHTVLKILEKYTTYIYKNTSLTLISESDRAGELMQTDSSLNITQLLVNIIKSTPNLVERKLAFDVLILLITYGKFPKLTENLTDLLTAFNYTDKVNFGIEDHCAIMNIVILLLISGDRSDLTLNSYYQL